ncbi:2-keto-3-deoxy-6-phosphogluconate aldolase [Bartonella callosciuri]|uniref:2-keto-3-deoxy-6-phosphogluconate aldolase n=1 Tax=Bartonella callosciuri TaxID=686223 RepID=A0A840NVG0_9HYPH|nr:2-keto-3-deoxy-6-phosphogluconate aldolase [Bartonella callosciuri]
MSQKVDHLLSLLQDQTVIPILRIDDIQSAITLARALLSKVD